MAGLLDIFKNSASGVTKSGQVGGSWVIADATSSPEQDIKSEAIDSGITLPSDDIQAEQQNIVIPPVDTAEVLPQKEVNDRAFYTSSLAEGDFNTNFEQVRFDLETTGKSSLYDQELRVWEGESAEMHRQAVVNALSDATIPLEQRKRILNAYNVRGTTPPNLRDKYIEKVATQDDHDLVDNKISQDKLVDVLNANLERHQEATLARETSTVGFNQDASSMLAGMARDVLIPGTSIGTNAYINAKFRDRLGVDTDEEVFDTIQSYILVGTNNKEIASIMRNTLDPEQRREMTLAMLEDIKNLPGTDYNRWSAIQDMLLQGELSIWEEQFENAIGLLDTFFGGKAISSPIKLLKNLIPRVTNESEKKLYHFIKNKASSFGKSQPITKQAATAAANHTQNIASNPPTGVNNGAVVPTPPATPSVQGTVPPVNTVTPSVNPGSPIGSTIAANPTHAGNVGAQAILNPSAATAAGTSPGELLGSIVLPKIDAVFIRDNPDAYKKILQQDEKFRKLFDDAKLDPYLVNTTERAADRKIIYETLQQARGAHYQVPNSSFEESLTHIKGNARYGKNEDFGFNTLREAELAEANIKTTFTNTPTSSYETKIVTDNGGQYYVDVLWNKEYDPFSARVFGNSSTDASIMGIGANGLGRSWLGKYILPATMRLDEWVTKGGFSAGVNASKIEEGFLVLQKEIRNTTHPKELNAIVNNIAENQAYMSRGDIASMFPYLDKKSLDHLQGQQELVKRNSDYLWNWTNRNERARMLSENKQGIYAANGDLLGIGNKVNTVPSTVRKVYDFGTKTGIARSQTVGKTIVGLDTPITRGSEKFTYAVVDDVASSLNMLPHSVVPKLEGYIPRINTENWYVKRTPKGVTENGTRVTDINILRKEHTSTIAAARNEIDGGVMVDRLKAQYPNDEVSLVRERGDTGNAIVTDYKVFKDMAAFGKTRGDRLPTVDGFSRLEDPFVALVNRSRTIARMDSWKDYDVIFKKNFLKEFGNYIKEGSFPNTIHDIYLPVNATEQHVKAFKTAQRLFEQYSNQRYKLNLSDEVWKSVGHTLADVLEGYKLNVPSDLVRDLANKGDLFRKGIKSLSNNLFINLSPVAQWVVQTPQILEFAAISPNFAVNSMKMLPALLVNMLGRAGHSKPYAGIMGRLAENISLSDKAEFNKIADAIYDAGLPQAVDMNMMLAGGIDELGKPLVQGLGEAAMNLPQQVLSKPGQVGKQVGYTPAQMMADMAGFLFAKERWQKLNPGLDWNTPTNIRRIAADGWDIMGSMNTRAGAFPYQDGYMGVLTQFAAIVHKQMFQVFSSKTLKKAPGEIVGPRAKLAGARLALWGTAGVPGATMIYNLIDKHTEGFSQDMKDLYEKYKGGMVDLLLNKSIDMMLSDPDLPPSDLAITDRVAPFQGDHLPVIDTLYTTLMFATGQKTDNPRFPFTNAVGSAFSAVTDMNNLWKTKEFKTVEALGMVMTEVAEMTSGYNNYAKAMMIQELGDKKDKFGNNLGLELNYTHAIAQMFGIVSQQEVRLRSMQFNKKERDTFIENRAKELHDGMLKLKGKVGDPDFMEYVRRSNILNSVTNETDKEEIMNKFISMDRDSYTTRKESIMLYLLDHHTQENDRYISNMVSTLSNGTERDKEFLEMLQREGMVPK